MTTTTPSTGLAAGTWNVDPAHSSVEFQVKHLGIATVKGFFSEFDGSLEVAQDGSISASGTIEAASVNTRSQQRDEHLRSADFFDVAEHPKLRFQSTAFEQTGEDTYRITGTLEIHGVANEIALDAELTGQEQDPWGNTRVGIDVSGSLEREQYGLTYNQALESGGVLVGKKVKILLALSAVKA